MAARVTIILVNWNALELTERALESLQRHSSGVSWQAIVVDNASRVEQRASRLAGRFARVQFVDNAENVGFGRACNQAARLCHDEYLLFLNTDTVQLEDAVAHTIAYLDEHPEVGAVGIKHLDEQGAWQPSAFRYPDPMRDTAACLGLSSLVADAPGYAADIEADVDWVCGSFLCVRQSVWREVGEFDERFFVYDEDIDWCLRAVRAGYKVRYLPSARMTHVGAASSALLRDKTFMHFRSRMTYYEKNAPAWSAAAFYVATSGRLGASTLTQVLKVGLGRSDLDAVAVRLRRLGLFALQFPARAGVRGVRS